MPKLKDVAHIFRSKNAGPFYITIDIIFHEDASYKAFLKSGWLTQERVSGLYQCNREDVEIYPYDPVGAIKISFPRREASGNVGDSDLFGAQQHVPLLEQWVEW